MTDTLPQGPRLPPVLQSIGNWSRPTPFLERARRRYGRVFTVRLLGTPPAVMISDPEQIKEIFQAPPDVLHPGEGASILEPVVGPHSVILLDEGPHLEQRKLLLPAFHGERMEQIAGAMAELTERELASWPREQPFALHPRLQRLTLEVILRTVFGLERGARLDALRELLTELLAFADSPLSLFPLPGGAARFIGAARRRIELGERIDARLYELIEERRATAEEQPAGDVLGMLLAATHEDGSPMSAQEIRDELVTALVAGHETTASQLAWAFAQLAREPAALGRLTADLDSGESEEYLNATINEVMRMHPVLPNAEPRFVKKPVVIGGVRYPPGVMLMANAYLVHHDPGIYPEPYAFRPERFIESPPGTYTLIPFGGGRRRCIGASFAHMEMDVVLRTMLQRVQLLPTTAPGEPWSFAGVVWAAGEGGQAAVRHLVRKPVAPELAAAAR